jgi:transcriptional regulator with XRE-family HTH domain
MMVRGHDPFVQRRRLSLELRRLRERSEETQQQVADALEWSLSKVIRIETATVTISLADLRSLLAHFKVEDAEVVEDLLSASRASRGKPWFDEYRDILTGEFRKLLAFESSASVIRAFCPQIVSGLFQTRSYALALAEVAASEEADFDDSNLERWVDARMKRQELLDQADAPAIHLILSEAVVRQIVADPQITADQLRHLRDLADRPGFTLQILPFDVGPHNGLWGPFTIHELVEGGEYENILFVESAGSDLLIRDDPALSARFLRRFDQLAELAGRPERTVTVLDDAIRRLQ